MRKLIKLFSVLLLPIFTFIIVNAQVQETWVRTLSSPSTVVSDELNDMVVDNAGNVYVTGHSSGGVVTRKYDKAGNIKWTTAYSAYDATEIAIDAAGNVYVGGETVDRHFLTLKYSPAGTILWAVSYDDDETGSVRDIAVDPSGNVYVTGVSYTAPIFPDGDDFADYATVKYSPGGAQVWIRRFNGSDPGQGFDIANAITIDALGFIYVTGTSQLNGRNGFATIKYHPDGTLLWIQRYEGSSGEEGGAIDIALDAFGNVIVVGLMKKDEPPSFDVYRNAIVVKYTFSGFELWSRSIFTAGSGHHVPLDIAIDAANNIIVTGYSEISVPGSQFLTKYDPSGNPLWLRQPSGVSGRHGHVATDGTNSYTVGFGNGGLTTKKFDSNGTEQWSITYATGTADPDERLIGVDGDQNVYVSSWYRPANFANSDYLTIRYSQCTLTCPGDITVNNDAGKCGAVVNYPDATATGDCGSTITYSKASGTMFDIGTTTVTVTSTETGATCSFNVTVNDVQNPVFTLCPSSKTVNVNAGVCYATASSVNAGTAIATDNCDYKVVGTRSDGLALTADYSVGNTSITWTATDASSNTATCSQTITIVDNVPPTISGESASTYVLSPPNHLMRDVTIDYAATDNCAVTATISVTSSEPINGVGDGDTDPDWIVVDNHHVRLRAERAAGGNGRIYTVTITAVDPSGNTTTKTIEVRVPHDIKKPNSGQAFIVGSTVNFEGEFWDKAGKIHTAKWLIDETTIAKTIVTEPSGGKNGKVIGSYKFASPGVYKLQMNITDQSGLTTYTNTAGDLEAIVVIFDPNGGNTYGGGYFNSPAGALRANPSATGKASYGFAMNYFKNSTYPKGETQFDFKVGEFEFNALNFEYLVINNSMAQFKGTGKITGGQSGVGFTMTVVDGQLDGTGIDKIRMKIYNKNNGTVIYDNQPGASDAALPIQAVGINSTIVISGSNSSLTSVNTNQKAEMEAQLPGVLNKLDLIAYPNPSTNSFSITVQSEAKEKVSMQVVDAYGRIIETRNVSANSIVRFGDKYRPGTYFVRIIQGKEHKETKLVKISD